MKELTEIKEILDHKRPDQWKQLPDIELYKDQVLSYMERQQVLQGENGRLTGPMVNNYIKSGLLPRPHGKKYKKEHLATLTAIAALKQVLTVEETDSLLKQQPNIQDTESFYEDYLRILDNALGQRSKELDLALSKDQLAAFALQLAINSYTEKLICERILEILNQENK